MGRKVTFSVSIGLVGCKRTETFDIDDLGYVKGEDYDTEEELMELLEEFWIDWRNEKVDGNIDLEDE